MTPRPHTSAGIVYSSPFMTSGGRYFSSVIAIFFFLTTYTSSSAFLKEISFTIFWRPSFLSNTLVAETFLWINLASCTSLKAKTNCTKYFMQSSSMKGAADFFLCEILLVMFLSTLRPLRSFISSYKEPPSAYSNAVPTLSAVSIRSRALMIFGWGSLNSSFAS